MSHLAMDEYQLKAFRLEADQIGRYLEARTPNKFYKDPMELAILRRIRDLREISTTYNQ